MIEARDERIDRALQVGEINEPAGVQIDGTADDHLAVKGVSMHTPALVPFGNIR